LVLFKCIFLEKFKNKLPFGLLLALQIKKK